LENQVVLGTTVKENKVYQLREEDLVKHVLTIGATGKGKTTLHRNIMTQLDTPYWVFDRKQDYRHLVTEQDLLVLPWRKMKLNPLKPPEDVDPNRWANIFSIIFSQCFDLLSGSEGFVTTAVNRLYKEYNVFTNKAHPYPSLEDFARLVKSDAINVGRASASYKDRTYWRLKPVLTSVGQLFDCSVGYTVDNLKDENVVFEIGGLNRNLQRFIQQILYAKTFEHLLANNRRDEGLQLVFFVDEAKQLFSVYLEMQEASGIPEIDDLMARSRQLGLSTIAADQEATKLTDSLKSNTDTKILLPVNDRENLESIAKSMYLNTIQKKYLRTLDAGQAIIQHGSENPTPVDLINHETEGTVSESLLEYIQEDKWQNLSYRDSVSKKVDGADNSDPSDSDLGKYL
jgi:type IV secretory pathway VirB4 component